MKKHLVAKLVAVAALVAVVAGFTVLARGAGTSAGTSSDPLVTLSYVNDTFRASLLSDVQQQINASAGAQNYQAAVDSVAAAFSQQLISYPDYPAESSYVTVTLLSGENLSLYSGQQLLVLSGEAKVAVNMIVDVTDGKSLSAGASLKENHFYNAPADTVLTASSELTLLVK